MAAILAAGVLALGGCSSSETGTVTSDTSVTESTPVSEEQPVILAVSFGTSYNDSREKTIGAIEKAIQEANPNCEVRRTFTSQTVIDILKKRDNIEIDNVEEALQRLVDDGVKKLVVQPTHVMSGYEYDDLVEAVNQYKDKFEAISMGTPLLTSDEDYKDVAKALVDSTKEYNNEDTAIVFMGHGTEHEANASYAKLQETLTAEGADNYYIGTVESTPSLDDVVKAVKKKDYKKVVLHPLMVVAGDHANNDMAGDEKDSWKSVFEKEGYDVTCVLEGLGQVNEIQQLYVDHVKTAMTALEQE